MRFYCKVEQFGNNLRVVGYDNGVRFQDRIPFEPTIFLKSKDPRSAEWHDMRGIPLEPFCAGGIKDTKEFIEKYDDVVGFDIWGNTNFIQQYISDYWTGASVKFDPNAVHVVTIDIETTVNYGFPNKENPQEEILLVTITSSRRNGNTFTWGTKGYKGKAKTRYTHCETESELLLEVLKFWKAVYPDVVTGWNVEMFDAPYLFKRIERVIGEEAAQTLSPWNSVREDTVKIQNREELTISISGISILDGIDLYKKYTYGSRESYSLDSISEYELGEQKIHYDGTFQEFYENDWELFVDYNVRDVELALRIEKKMKFIPLIWTMAYKAKVNYEDIFSPVKTWEAIIYNKMKNDHIVPPKKRGKNNKSEQYEGAYVKEPKPGLYKWVVSFDYASLYPSIIQTLNISPETKMGVQDGIDAESMIAGKVNTEWLVEQNMAMGANGALYNREKIGLLPALVQDYINWRKSAKKEMLRLKAEQEKTGANLEDLIAAFDNEQMAAKILLNSLYGGMGNQYFAYYDLDNARAITLTGQAAIRYVENVVNSQLSKIFGLKHVHPFVIYIDTDAIYVAFDSFLDKFIDKKNAKEACALITKFSQDKVGVIIDAANADFQNRINAFNHALNMKLEITSDRAIWVSKKRYAANVYSSEGVEYAKPKLKVMGLEIVKSSTPMKVREKLKEALPIILHSTQGELQGFVESFRQDFIKLQPEEIAFPRSANNLAEYAGYPIYSKGTPMQVKAALIHNHLVKSKGLDKKVKMIREGEKIKYLALRKANPTRELVVGFSGTFPKEFGLHPYVDYDEMFDKAFLQPLLGLTEAAGWLLSSNNTLDEFFN